MVYAKLWPDLMRNFPCKTKIWSQKCASWAHKPENCRRWDTSPIAHLDPNFRPFSTTEPLFLDLNEFIISDFCINLFHIFVPWDAVLVLGHGIFSIVSTTVVAEKIVTLCYSVTLHHTICMKTCRYCLMQYPPNCAWCCTASYLMRIAASALWLVTLIMIRARTSPQWRQHVGKCRNVKRGCRVMSNGLLTYGMLRDFAKWCPPFKERNEWTKCMMTNKG